MYLCVIIKYYFSYWCDYYYNNVKSNLIAIDLHSEAQKENAMKVQI